ncbi:Cytochrome-P450 [Teratosphaeria destructans]|uniref:Cytochrome-P450 n=1 Tax=Teratosphaeria destructans TaxID=418781 RepID=A0A9W7T0F7_9PEZI|nr:Cytochrome-P450 [Teratosphaeria destructans]
MMEIWETSRLGWVGISVSILVAIGFFAIVHAILTYHGPLWRVPGPRWRAITILPHLYSMWTGKEAATVVSLHEKYGPVVRLGPDLVSFIGEGKVWKQIYASKSQGISAFPKDMLFYDKPLSNVNGPFTTEDHENIRQRKALAPAFSEVALRRYEERFKSWCLALRKRLDKSVQEQTPVDMVKAFNCTTFDIMSDMLLSEPLKLLEKGDYVPYVTLIFKLLRHVTQFKTVRYFNRTLGWGLQALLLQIPAIRQLAEKHHHFIVEQVDKRLGRTEGSDIWAFITADTAAASSLDREERYSIANEFMIAGTETSATTLSGLLYHLLCSPEWLQRLTQDLRAQFSSIEQISMAELQNNKILDAILKEGMRVYPPVPVGFPRFVPKGGIEIEGYYMPEGTRVNLAWHEMRLILAATLISFDFELHPDSSPWSKQQNTFMVWEKPPLYVNVKRAAARSGVMDAPASVYRITGGLLCLVVVFTLAKAVYRLLFHPLRSVPGPWLNKVSAIPGALQLLLRRQHVYYHRLHAQYGPVVRVGPNEVIWNNAQSWDEIYGFRSGQHLERAPTFIGIVDPAAKTKGIGISKGKDHIRHRRALGRFFTKPAVQSQREVLHLYVDKLMARIRIQSKQDGRMNMSRWYAYFTFDFMTHLVFGEPYESLSQAPATEWPDAVFNLMVSATWDQSARLVAGSDTWLSRLLLKLMPAEAMEWRKTHVTKVREKLANCLSEACKDRGSIARQLSEGTNGAAPLLTAAETLLDTALLVVAGAETTSILLTGLSYCICTNPHAYAKLVEEIRTAFKSTKDVTLESSGELQYLDAAIREALRILPPASVNNQRAAPKGGTVVQGIYLPEGTLIGISPWAASRSPANFHAPEEYHPERWLQGVDARFRDDQLGASRPFGYGPRACIGESMAMAETKLLMSTLLLKYDIRLEGRMDRPWALGSESEPMEMVQTLRFPDLWMRFDEVEG